jgi:hypothetical protein
MKKEMVATLSNPDIIPLCIIFFVVITFRWRVIGMIFEKAKHPTKPDIYFGVYVRDVSRREFIYINDMWTVRYITLCVRTRPKMTYTFFSNALQFGNAGRLRVCYLSWIITLMLDVTLKMMLLKQVCTSDGGARRRPGGARRRPVRLWRMTWSLGRCARGYLYPILFPAAERGKM